MSVKPQASEVELFAENFKKARKRAGLTQADIERLAGIQRSMVSDIEGGKQNVTLDTASRLAHAVGKPLSELVKA